VLWLLAAELRKLIRPLVWGAGLAIIGFCLLITWGGANNASGALASPRIPDVCARAVTAQCQQVVAHVRTLRPGPPRLRPACSRSPAK
jgi:hypothetical protein